MHTPDRKSLFQYLKIAADKADEKNTGLAFIIIEIRRFRRINNLYGYKIGEQILSNLSKRITNIIREQDRLFVTDHNQLALILPELKNPHIAELASNKIIQASKEIFNIEGNNLSIDIAIGISLYPDHTQEEEMLLHQSEDALRQAKQNGDAYSTYIPTDLPGKYTTWDIESELQLALDNNKINFHYQPKVNLQTGQLYGAEALARWNHDEHGFVSPEIFIKASEKTGKIQKLTQHCINTSLRNAAQWPTNHGALKVAINLSPTIINSPDIFNLFQSGLNIWGVSPERLIVEITESGVVADPSLSSTLFNQLREMGAQISIDDFGTGHSSLTNFKKIPAKELKIDCSFIIDMLKDEGDRIIVENIIQLAHGFKMKVVAEGIEDHETYLALAEMGCDYGQGYYIGRPMSQDAFIEWLEKYKPI